MNLMPKDVFMFKQFTIYQPYPDVMKVSTDSVLLGCFAEVSTFSNALDIGCGTGLLALMMAQKNPALHITAIDIHTNAYKCAVHNVQHSVFQKQITVLNISLKNFLDQSKISFDGIICNPPYFFQSLKSHKPEKNRYRHQEELRYEEVLMAANNLLNPKGCLFLVVPYYERKRVDDGLLRNQLFIHRLMEVYASTKKQQPYIYLLAIRKEEASSIKKEKLYIRDGAGYYTWAYKEFTKDFYLWAE